MTGFIMKLKLFKKYAFISLLFLLTTTIAPLNANIINDLIDEKALREWCLKYVSEERLKTIETSLEVVGCALFFAFSARGLMGLGKGKEQMHKRKNA